MSYLRSVNNSDDSDQESHQEYVFDPDTAEHVPAFEGHPVHFTRVKLSNVGDLDLDAIHHIDDIVKMYVEGRVVRVDHVVDEASGKMKRIHTIKAVDAIPLNWDVDPHELEKRG